MTRPPDLFSGDRKNYEEWTVDHADYFSVCLFVGRNKGLYVKRKAQSLPQARKIARRIEREFSTQGRKAMIYAICGVHDVLVE